MFQSFEILSNPSQGRKNIAALRALLKKRNLKGFMVPRGDEHMNEYVAPYAERLSWVSGFTGSAGVALILQKKAAVFVDGRYTLQVRDQVDTELFDICQIPQDKPSDWLTDNLSHGDRLAYDPNLHTQETVEHIADRLKKIGAKLVPVKQNLVDLVWEDQPARPLQKVSLQPLKYTGKSCEEKIARLIEDIDEDAVVLTLPDSIAWLFNIRGADVPHTPLPLSYAILRKDGKPELFIDPRKLNRTVSTNLQKNCTIFEPEKLEERLRALKAMSVRVDDETASSWVAQTLKKGRARLIHKPDPCVALKAVKTDAEIEGSRAAHLRDGVAICRFLAWLARQEPVSSIDEIQAAKTLEEFRTQTNQLMDISFDTISAVGAHGAIVHYRVTEKSNQKFKRGTLYLVDSGGQYRDGTTDITRTVALGRPSKEMCRRFTQVLKGHIALSLARFPEGTRGQDLDPLVRAPLWAAGLDFDHGTGHGVGSYLSVHEGPQRIARTCDVALQPGMILSNEPGYYKQGAFGIRIENLVLVTAKTPIKDGEREMMGFEVLTLAPIDRSLVDPAQLTSAELDWLNSYHARVAKLIAPHLGPEEKAWLQQATAPL